MDKKLSIIIVSWNVCDLLRACLHSIEQTKGDLAVEVIVVDNASSDDTVAMISVEFPQTILIAQTENIGFPAGNNVGLAVSMGDFLFLLNPDTEIRPNALQELVAFLEENPEVGLVGPKLLNVDRSIQSSRRRFPTILVGIFEATWLQAYAPKRLLNRFYVADIDASVSAEVDWVTGAAMFTRREVYEQVGGLDPGYFMYSEELDWCRRIKSVGWKIAYTPKAEVYHYEGASSEQAVTARHINFNRAKLRYFRKYHGIWAYRLLKMIIQLTYLHQIITEALKLMVGHKKDLRKQRIQAYYQVLLAGFGAAGY